MRILIIEDQDEKFEVVAAEIRGFFNEPTVEVTRAETMALATKHIFERRFDLIIIDLMVPLRPGDEPEDITEEIIPTIELSERNRGANIIALSGFEELVGEQRVRFAEAGIILLHFDDEESNWRKQIAAALMRIHHQYVYDFVIICALDKERNAYRSTNSEIGDLRNIRGLDCLPITVSNLNGVCIKLPRMGLVDASVVTSRAIERFNPKIIAMSGICAGVGSDAKIGTLVVADPCWEYQAGKWAHDGFKIEHYDACLDINTRTILSQFIDRSEKGSEFKKGLIEDQILFEEIIIAPMATGSAVIADKDKLTDIQEQHRKIAAIEMEMYGVYKAAQLSATNPIVFGAKTVVDRADSKKDDRFHEYGSILSARFVLAAISELHKNLISASSD